MLAFINIVAIQSAASFVIWTSGIARGDWTKLLAPMSSASESCWFFSAFYSPIFRRWLAPRCSRPALRMISNKDSPNTRERFWPTYEFLELHKSETL